MTASIDRRIGAEKIPLFVDFEEGLYLRILGAGESLTDLPPYQHLKGKTVEEVYPSFAGDTRLMDTVDDRERQILIARAGNISDEPTGIYNHFYNAMGGFALWTLLTEREFDRAMELYQSAKEENRLPYSSTRAGKYTNLDLYFSRGVSAYLAVSAPETCLIPDWNYDIKKMKESDPAFFEFMESLVREEGA